ncbi:type II secretion system F family protein [Candidatus Micrarchaeota archaeon]|nr:type II secretion system F family protein [Candidatus Micrarchaeota archaeon]
MQKELEFSKIDVLAWEWAQFSITVGVFSGILGSLIAFYYSGNFAALLFLPIAILIFVSLILFLPFYLKKKRAEEIEIHLPMALRAISLKIEMDLPFEKILKDVSNGGFGELGEEFSIVLREMEILGMEKAISNIGRRVDSEFARKACQLLIAEYRSGAKSSGIANLADQVSFHQKTKAQEYFAKSSLLGIAFIAVSCIVPALFATYVVIGSAVLSLTLTPNDIYFAYLVVFPLLSLCVLVYIREKTPKILAI